MVVGVVRGVGMLVRMVCVVVVVATDADMKTDSSK